jgi:hypothetical protein
MLRESRGAQSKKEERLLDVMSWCDVEREREREREREEQRAKKERAST